MTQTKETVKRTCDSYADAIARLLSMFNAKYVDVVSGCWSYGFQSEVRISGGKADVSLATKIHWNTRDSVGFNRKPEITPGLRGFTSKEWAEVTFWASVDYEDWGHEFARSASHDDEGNLIADATPAKDVAHRRTVSAVVTKVGFSLVGWPAEREEFMANVYPQVANDLRPEVDKAIERFDRERARWKEAVDAQRAAFASIEAQAMTTNVLGGVE